MFAVIAHLKYTSLKALDIYSLVEWYFRNFIEELTVIYDICFKSRARSYMIHIIFKKENFDTSPWTWNAINFVFASE